MKKTLQTLKLFYYTIYVVTLGIVAVGTYCLPISYAIEIAPTTKTMITSILVLFMLISIPLALKNLHKTALKAKEMADEAEKLQIYKRATLLVLALIAIGLLASIICFYLFGKENSYIYMAGIEILALLFCKPSEKRMNADLMSEIVKNEQDNELKNEKL